MMLIECLFGLIVHLLKIHLFFLGYFKGVGSFLPDWMIHEFIDI